MSYKGTIIFIIYKVKSLWFLSYWFLVLGSLFSVVGRPELVKKLSETNYTHPGPSIHFAYRRNTQGPAFRKSKVQIITVSE